MFVVLLAAVLTGHKPNSPTTYVNPVINVDAPDPGVLPEPVDGVYWMASTGRGSDGGGFGLRKSVGDFITDICTNPTPFKPSCTIMNKLLRNNTNKNFKTENNAHRRA